MFHGLRHGMPAVKVLPVNVKSEIIAIQTMGLCKCCYYAAPYGTNTVSLAAIDKNVLNKPQLLLAIYPFPYAGIYLLLEDFFLQFAAYGNAMPFKELTAPAYKIAA